MAMYVFINDSKKMEATEFPKSTKVFKTLNELNNELPDGYTFAEVCKENNHSGIDLPVDSIWYSFDDTSKNFHIVPADPQLFDFLGTILGKVLEEHKKTAKEKGLRVSFGKGCAKNHRWVATSRENYGYLFSFNRLWCDTDKHIHNNFGQVQFMRYRIKCDSGKELADRYQNINWDVGPKFKMMYPISGEDGEGQFDRDSGHLSYNAPFELSQIVSDGKIDWNSEHIKEWISGVAKAFAEFIDLGKIMEEKRDAPYQV